MKKIDIVKQIIKENGGIAKTAQLNEAGVQNSEIKKMCENGELERVKHGYYQASSKADVSEERMIATFLDEGIICMESALFHYGYSDKTPLVWTIAVSRNISRTKIKINNFPCKIYFVQEDKLLMGKAKGMFNGIQLSVYDREECTPISEEKKTIGFFFKIKLFFKYRITDWNFYKQDIPKIIVTFQAMYYRAKQEELSAEIGAIEKYLNSVDKDLLVNLCNQSMAALKDKLARKYENNSYRKIFSEDSLWQVPYEVLEEYPVILSTTFSSRSSLNSHVIYDYLIMDEASQVDIATGALSLSCAKNVVIVGDTKQLPNVVTDDIKAKSKAIFDSFNINAGYMYTKSFLQSILDVMPNVTQTLLREHYRCHPKIINFCNQKFYHGELIIMTVDKGEKDVLLAVKTVKGNHERNHYSQRQIDVIKEEVIPKYVLNPEKTGIIAPYKNQVEALDREISIIDAATVHKFQGKEKDNIIISTVDDEISDFVDDPYLICCIKSKEEASAGCNRK